MNTPDPGAVRNLAITHQDQIEAWLRDNALACHVGIELIGSEPDSQKALLRLAESLALSHAFLSMVKYAAATLIKTGVWFPELTKALDDPGETDGRTKVRGSGEPSGSAGETPGQSSEDDAGR